MFKQTIIFILLLVIILALKIPVEDAILQLGISAFKSHHLAGIPSRVLIIILSIYLIIKNKIHRVSNVLNPLQISNLQAISIPLILFLLALFINKHNFENSNVENTIVFLLSAFCVGIAEEMAFRGFLFPYITKHSKNIILSMMVNSLIFGLFHYINLFKTPKNIYGISTQVAFAFSIGMFFCGLLLRTKNIYVLGVLHFLFNISFGSGELKQINQIIESNARASPNIASIAIILIIFALIAVSGLIMKRMSNESEFIEELLPTKAMMSTPPKRRHGT